MNDDVIIRAEELGKKYTIGRTADRERYTALRDVVARGARRWWRKTVDLARGRAIVEGDMVEEFWALKDVSFDVKRGEVLGIIGRNGAGKSTLLKILSRITEPSAGRATISGRVASLLEVGTGFHPELTGRENIFLNGAILGMTRAEIRRKFDEIVAFAEVEKFLDTPVKRYSSGMYVRLAFSVAAHLEPEIVVVDEILAVGDAEFQRKCLGKMDQVSRHEGRTVLVVSHNMGVIGKLCARAMWLDRGGIREFGSSRRVIGQYLANGSSNRETVISLRQCERPIWLQDDRLRLTALEFLTPIPLQNGEPATLRLQLETRAPVMGASAIIGFNSMEGTRNSTYHMGLRDKPRRDLADPGTYSAELIINSLPLGPSIYDVDVLCRSGDLHFLDAVSSCAQAEVVAGPSTPPAIAQSHLGVRVEGTWRWAPGDDNMSSMPYLRHRDLDDV